MIVNATKLWAESMCKLQIIWFQGEQDLVEAQRGWREAECGWGALRNKCFTKPLDTLKFIFLLQLKTWSYSWRNYGENY